MSESAGVVCHAAQSVGIHLLEQLGDLGVARRCRSYQQEDGCDAGRDLEGQGAPALDDPSAICLACLELVGALLGRHGACPFERPRPDGADEAGLAAEGLVHRVRGDTGVVGDGRDRRRAVSVTEEAPLGRVDRPCRGSGERAADAEWSRRTASA